jgi:RNA polymerase sigma-70 factor (ECF subfamily)
VKARAPQHLRLVDPAGPEVERERSDAEIGELAKARDPRGATLVWDRYAGMVRSILYRSLGPDREVDDLVQDVFIGFFRNVHSLREVESLRGFLAGIATRTALGELRRRRVRRWLRLSPEGHLPDVPAPTGDPRAREALRRLYAILDELPASDRMAFVLRHAEGHMLSETATLLGVSLATVKRMLQRAEAHVAERARNDDLLADWTESPR